MIAGGFIDYCKEKTLDLMIITVLPKSRITN